MEESLMPFLMPVLLKTRETLEIYWVLVRITVPITILTELLSRMGVIKAIGPAFAPVMNLVGLPPELGLAWLTGMLVGIWGAVPLIFTLVPPSSLTVADITVFSSLILFAHGLPIEQKIIQKAGPSMVMTTTLRTAGGLLYAFLLHHILLATGWLSAQVDPAWIPMSATPDWLEYVRGLGETMISMLVILFILSWGLEILKVTGLLKLMMTPLPPLAACRHPGRGRTSDGGRIVPGDFLRRRPSDPRGAIGRDIAAADLPVMCVHGFCAQRDRGHPDRGLAWRRRLRRPCRATRFRHSGNSGGRRAASPPVRQDVL